VFSSSGIATGLKFLFDALEFNEKYPTASLIITGTAGVLSVASAFCLAIKEFCPERNNNHERRPLLAAPRQEVRNMV